ncbi:MAG TPA: M81 family metallopeptidase [Azospirillaceae bacterium]|nr:M81 family metallopeptidase [Azospirillaceae bacterium]
MARIAVAGFLHETNTFVPTPTGWPEFDDPRLGGYRVGARILDLAAGPFAIGGFADELRTLGHDIVPLAYAEAEPGGIVTAEAFERVCGDICRMLRKAAPVDGVLLDLHGALVTPGHEDGDAEIARRVRAVVGKNIPVVAALDSHGNIQAETLAPLDAAVGYRTYPHVDMNETGRRAVRLMDRLLRTAKRPHRVLVRPDFLLPTDRQTTLADPMRGLYGLLEALEAEDTAIWTASLMLGFHLSDVPFAGPSVFAFADTAAAAEQLAHRLVEAMAAREREFVSDLMAPDAAARIARDWRGEKPLLLADVQDNAGGGASSDTVEVLEALARHRVQGVILGLLHDPAAVAAAHAAGVGAAVDLEVGGKGVPGQRPFTAGFQVEHLSREPYRLTGPVAGGSVMDLGPTAMVRLDGIRVVLTSGRTQCLDQAFFRHHGIEPARQRVIVVKSANHYRADFQPLAERIINVESAGFCVVNPAALTFRRLRQGVRLHGHGPRHGGDRSKAGALDK